MPSSHDEAAVSKDAWAVYVEWKAAELQRRNEALVRRNQRLFQSLMFAHNKFLPALTPAFHHHCTVLDPFTETPCTSAWRLVEKNGAILRNRKHSPYIKPRPSCAVSRVLCAPPHPTILHLDLLTIRRDSRACRSWRSWSPRS